MDPERQGTPGAAPDPAEERTLGGDEWPVDDHYFIAPDPEPAEGQVEMARAGETDPVAAPPPAAALGGRPRPAAVALAVLVLALLLAAAAGAWLVFRPSSAGTGSSHAATQPPSSGSGGPSTSTSTTTSTSTSTTTTTPASQVRSVVPDVGGLTLDDARSRLDSAGLRGRVRRQPSDAPRDQVLRQSPDAGTKLRHNRFVVLTVSGGVARVDVPDVEGLRADDAAKKTRAAGLVPEVHLVRSTSPAGIVLRQDPSSGEQVARGATLTLDVAKHVAKPRPVVVQVRVPRVVGLSMADARSRLGALGLHADGVRVDSNRPEGTVVQQSPAAGSEVRKGSTVRLSVSGGPAQAMVPSVVGLDQQSAEAQLQSAGFEVRVVTQSTSDPSEDGTVLDQDPQGGTKADDGSTVTITVGQSS